MNTGTNVRATKDSPPVSTLRRHSRASVIASGAAPRRTGREKRPRANHERYQRVLGPHVSSRHFLACRSVAIELTDQRATVLRGRIGKLLYEVFDLLARGVFEGFGAAEIDSIGLDQLGRWRQYFIDAAPSA